MIQSLCLGAYVQERANKRAKKCTRAATSGWCNNTFSFHRGQKKIISNPSVYPPTRASAEYNRLADMSVQVAADPILYIIISTAYYYNIRGHNIIYYIICAAVQVFYRRYNNILYCCLQMVSMCVYVQCGVWATPSSGPPP